MARSSNLQAIIDACHNSTIPNAGVIRVISNREKAYGLERAKRASRLSQTDILHKCMLTAGLRYSNCVPQSPEIQEAASSYPGRYRCCT